MAFSDTMRSPLDMYFEWVNRIEGYHESITFSLVMFSGDSGVRVGGLGDCFTSYYVNSSLRSQELGPEVCMLRIHQSLYEELMASSLLPMGFVRPCLLYYDYLYFIYNYNPREPDGRAIEVRIDGSLHPAMFISGTRNVVILRDDIFNKGSTKIHHSRLSEVRIFPNLQLAPSGLLKKPGLQEDGRLSPDDSMVVKIYDRRLLSASLHSPVGVECPPREASLLENILLFHRPPRENREGEGEAEGEGGVQEEGERWDKEGSGAVGVEREKQGEEEGEGEGAQEMLVEQEEGEDDVHRYLLSEEESYRIMILSGKFFNDRWACVCLPYVPGSDIIELLIKLTSVSFSFHPDTARAIASDCAISLAALHRLGYFHLDVSPENYLVDTRQGRCVLIDFGQAGAANEDDGFNAMLHSQYKTVYKPYELDNDFPVITDVSKCDVFALGVTFFVLLTRTLPFHRCDHIDLIRGVNFESTSSNTWAGFCHSYRENAGIARGMCRSCEMRQVWYGHVHQRCIKLLPVSGRVLGEVVDPSALDLLEKMLESEPDKRIDMQGVLHHEWCAGMDSSSRETIIKTLVT